MAGGAGRCASPGRAYQLYGGRLATEARHAEQQEKLTSDKLEGLGYELVAVLAVLVVRHDCDGGLSVVRAWAWRQWQAALQLKW